MLESCQGFCSDISETAATPICLNLEAASQVQPSKNTLPSWFFFMRDFKQQILHCGSRKRFWSFFKLCFKLQNRLEQMYLSPCQQCSIFMRKFVHVVEQIDLEIQNSISLHGAKVSGLEGQGKNICIWCLPPVRNAEILERNVFGC